MKKPKLKGVLAGGKKRGGKLTPAEVVKVKELLSNGVSEKIIAERFGISVMAVNKIARGESYGDLKTGEEIVKGKKRSKKDIKKKNPKVANVPGPSKKFKGLNK